MADHLNDLDPTLHKVAKALVFFFIYAKLLLYKGDDACHVLFVVDIL